MADTRIQQRPDGLVLPPLDMGGPTARTYAPLRLQESRRAQITFRNADLPASTRALADFISHLFPQKCGGDDSVGCTGPKALTPRGLLPANLSINDEGDVAFDGVVMERAARQVYVIFEGTAEPVPIAGASNNTDPSISNYGNILYREGPAGGATIRMIDEEGTDSPVTPEGNCFFPEISSDGSTGTYLCQTVNGSTLFVTPLHETSQESRINPEGTAVEEGALSAGGRYVAFSTRTYFPEAEGDGVKSDKNGMWDVYIRDRRLDRTTRISLDAAGQERNYPSGNPRLLETNQGLLVSYVTVSEDTGNQSVVVFDLGRREILAEIETDRPASAAGRVDIRPDLAGDDGRYLLIRGREGLYLHNWKTGERKLVDAEGEEGVMNRRGRIAYLKGGKIFVVDVCHFI